MEKKLTLLIAFFIYIVSMSAQLIYSVDSEWQADKKVYFVDSEWQADLTIYFVSSEWQAEWNDKSKIHLMY